MPLETQRRNAAKTAEPWVSEMGEGVHADGVKGAWTPPEAWSYVRSGNDAFSAGRLDAEYFHPAKTQALDSFT